MTNYPKLDSGKISDFSEQYNYLYWLSAPIHEQNLKCTLDSRWTFSIAFMQQLEPTVKNFTCISTLQHHEQVHLPIYLPKTIFIKNYF